MKQQVIYSGGANPIVRITVCSWDRFAIVREAGRRMVEEYGAALERLAEHAEGKHRLRYGQNA